MTSTVATDIPQGASPAKPLTETWANNEHMRHVPLASWIVRKVDEDLRRRIEIVCSSYESAEPKPSAAEGALNALCRAVNNLAEAARHERPHQDHADITTKVRHALQHAVASLSTLDESLFGRRYPFQTLERSKGEVVVGALLHVIETLKRAVEAMRPADPALDERLLDGLVTLQEPLRTQPIA